ncbi:MAG: dTDP-4-dehydrorhamnose 3,5-epimerase family protein [Bryobacterales bacterium]|nr:dTDP-4-dehydrorhamnose 3,5-epimerase family protein [Bryobacterales bacterium]
MTPGNADIVIPKCEKGLGEVIGSPQASGLIEGVRIEPLSLYPDDRGYFLEILRAGQGLVRDYDPRTTQVSAAMNYPGAIKAFHYHLRQTDVFTPIAGLLQIALVDLREDSRTFGRRNTIYSGPLRLWQVLIPPGVGHGYKVLGTDPSLMVYATDRFYDPQDEGRIPYNHPDINYDWELQHK